eukprot:4956851-Pyramimonas_sp.AAC.1
MTPQPLHGVAEGAPCNRPQPRTSDRARVGQAPAARLPRAEDCARPDRQRTLEGRAGPAENGSQL